MRQVVQVVAAALPGLLALVGVVYVRRDSRRAENRKVDAEAYSRARKIDADTMAHLQAELDRERADRQREREETRREIDREREETRREIGRLEKQIEVLRADLSSSARNEARLLEHIDKLEATVARLRARLAVAGLLDDRQHGGSQPGPG